MSHGAHSQEVLLIFGLALEALLLVNESSEFFELTREEASGTDSNIVFTYFLQYHPKSLLPVHLVRVLNF